MAALSLGHPWSLSVHGLTSTRLEVPGGPGSSGPSASSSPGRPRQPLAATGQSPLTTLLDQSRTSPPFHAPRRVLQHTARAGGPETFLSVEEAGLVEMAGLDMHERFLARLTVSSLNLLRVISEQEGVPIEELNAGKICDWFVKDKQKRQTDRESAVLKWDDIPNL